MMPLDYWDEEIDRHEFGVTIFAGAGRAPGAVLSDGRRGGDVGVRDASP
jgi:hypothetical protein